MVLQYMRRFLHNMLCTVQWSSRKLFCVGRGLWLRKKTIKNQTKPKQNWKRNIACKASSCAVERHKNGAQFEGNVQRHVNLCRLSFYGNSCLVIVMTLMSNLCFPGCWGEKILPVAHAGGRAEGPQESSGWSCWRPSESQVSCLI